MLLLMLIVRAYKKNKSGRSFWEYKIIYRCIFTGKTKQKVKRGFQSKEEATAAAEEMMKYLKK